MNKIKTYFENRIVLFIGTLLMLYDNNILKSIWFFISGWFVSYDIIYCEYRRYAIKFYLNQNIDNLDNYSRINLLMLLSEEYDTSVDEINVNDFL